MTEKPWLTDPKYGGMSEEAARRSYEAWVKQGRRVLTAVPRDPRPPAAPEEIARIKRSIEVQLDEYEQAIKAATIWMAEWKSRQRGFRAVRRNRA